MTKAKTFITPEGLNKLIAQVPKKPIQPKGHENRCPCMECETWANELLDWQHEMLEEGFNPFVR